MRKSCRNAVCCSIPSMTKTFTIFEVSCPSLSILDCISQLLVKLHKLSIIPNG